MALNVQSLPWADEFPRVNIGTRLRVPAFMLVCGLDVAALAGPLLLLGKSAQLDWRAPAVVVLAIGCLAIHGHYRTRISPNVTREAGGLVGCVALSALFVAALPVRGVPKENATVLVQGGLLAVVLVLLGRALSYTAVRAVRARSALEPTLIIGAGSVGVEMAQTLLEHPEYGLVPVGFLDNFDDSGPPAPPLGTVRSLDAVPREYD